MGGLGGLGVGGYANGHFTKIPGLNVYKSIDILNKHTG